MGVSETETGMRMGENHYLDGITGKFTYFLMAQRENSRHRSAGDKRSCCRRSRVRHPALYKYNTNIIIYWHMPCCPGMPLIDRSSNHKI